MCGSFTPPGRRSIRPGTMPSPFAPPASSPSSNRICRPTQMPSTGAPRAIASRRASATPLCRIASALRHRPCPGTTTRSARRTRSGSRVTTTSAPTSRSAFSTERRFPRHSRRGRSSPERGSQRAPSWRAPCRFVPTLVARGDLRSPGHRSASALPQPVGRRSPPPPLLAPGQPHPAPALAVLIGAPSSRKRRSFRAVAARRPGGGLEDRLDDVVQVPPVADVHVQADARVVHERLQEVLREIDVVPADELLAGGASR